MTAVKPTKPQFAEFLAIRESGVTNMCDFAYITRTSFTGLNQDICLYIMEHFNALREEYGDCEE